MRLRSVVAVVACVVLTGGMNAVMAQAAAQVTGPQGTTVAIGPVFDVVSVRPAAQIDQATIMAGLRMGRRPEQVAIDGDRARFTYYPLRMLLAYAYKVRLYQVSGPPWMTTARFDVIGKLPEGTTKDDVPAMLKAMLADRFHLQAHLETKDHPVLGLMPGKGGVKLQAVPAPAALADDAAQQPGAVKQDTIDGPMILTHTREGETKYDLGARGSMLMRIDGQTGTMHLLCSAMTIKGLANILTSLGGGNGRPVIDMTELTGNYDMAVDFSLDDLMSSLRDSGIDIPGGPRGNGDGASDPNGDTTVSDALAKLGLKMTPTNAPIEQLVVDQVEKMATDN
jgi:uncharacterized protein (TIGR03435 family)